MCHNILMQQLRDLVTQAITDLDLETVNFGIDHPKDESHGDYSSNIAMILAKQMGEVPRELAQKILDKIPKSEIVDKVEIAGPGFINFYLTKEFLLTELGKAVIPTYGKNELGKGKLAIVEYSSPNIAKPFTIGHLRSTVIGDSVANLLEYSGYRVLRDNHLGDWGTQFGKQITAIKHWGSIEDIGRSANPVKDLVALYVKFHEEAEKNPALEDEAREWFKKLENGDAEARDLWQKCIDFSWVEFKRIYDLLGVHHSSEFNDGRGLGESFFENKMGDVIVALEDKKLLKEGKEGAKLVFFENDKYPPAMILKKDGATLYHTRDLATDKYRLEKYRPDLVVNEVGAEQQLYFQQLFEIERILGWYKPGQRVHVMHGMFRFKEGKMSTRKGNVVWLEEVLDEAIKRAEILGKGDKKVAQQVGIGALKWNDLKGEARRDIVFDWEEILNMKGNSGPFVQYTYARASSIIRRFSESANPTLSDSDVSASQLVSEELALLRWIYRYPEAVEEASTKLAPHIVAGYIYELAARFNTFYQACRVEEEGKVNELRYLLTQASANVLGSGLGLLGIVAPEEM